MLRRCLEYTVALLTLSYLYLWAHIGISNGGNLPRLFLSALMPIMYSDTLEIFHVSGGKHLPQEGWKIGWTAFWALFGCANASKLSAFSFMGASPLTCT